MNSHSPDQSTPSFVVMAVPTHLVGKVASLIADESGFAAAQAVPAETLLNGWTEEVLREYYDSSSPAMQHFLTFLADNADKEMDADAAADELEVDGWNSIAGMLGAAGRRMKNWYELTSPPWRQRWTPDGRSRFRMPRDVASIILDEAERIG